MAAPEKAEKTPKPAPKAAAAPAPAPADPDAPRGKFVVGGRWVDPFGAPTTPPHGE